METEKRTYILWDSQAADGFGTEEASVFVVCDSEDEALSYCGHFGAMACYSYRDDGDTLTDERFEWDWFPGSKRRKRRSQRRKAGK